MTDPEVMKLFSVTVDDLTNIDPTTCQDIARELLDAGFEAVLTWSVADPPQKNLVAFVDHLQDDSGMAVTRS